MRLFLLATSAATAATGCFAKPLRLRAEYTPVGPVGQTRPVRADVTTLSDVVVYYKSAPAGFTLRENELKVEPGFHHIILGELVVARRDGACYVPQETISTPQGRRYRYTNQRDVLDTLRQKAYVIGANAVVYAYSSLKQKSDKGDACEPLRLPGLEYGGGWAVIVR